MIDPIAELEVQVAPARWRRISTSPFFETRLAPVGALFMLVILVMIVAPSIFHTIDPNRQDLNATLAPGGHQHLLGTDNLGRDLWSRLVYGARPTLLGALAVISVAAAVGVPLGLVAGYYSGIVSGAIMRGVDMGFAFPGLILAILITSTFGRGLTMSAVALGLVYSPSVTRFVRSVSLVQRGYAYVEGAKAMGYGDGRILFRHILPNIMSPLIVTATIYLAGAILDLAALSYLGLGIQPPTPDWGSMISDGKDYLLFAPNEALFAGLGTALTVIALNLVGDGLRSQLDPRQRA